MSGITLLPPGHSVLEYLFCTKRLYTNLNEQSRTKRAENSLKNKTSLNVSKMVGGRRVKQNKKTRRTDLNPIRKTRLRSYR